LFRRRPKKKFSRPLHEVFTPKSLERLHAERPAITMNVLRELARLHKQGLLIEHTAIDGTKIRYFKRFRKIAGPKYERQATWGKPVVIARALLWRRKKNLPKGAIWARHDVYAIQVDRSKTRLARKVYEGVTYKPQRAGKEAINLYEAKKRGIPVVDVVRIDTNLRENRADLYTLMPPGFKDFLAYSRNSAIRDDRVIEELAREIGKMHVKGMFHGDLRKPNVLWNGSAAYPKIIFINLETAEFYDGKIPFSKAIHDIKLFSKSFSEAEEAPNQYTAKQMELFADVYSKETGFDREKVLGNIARATPSTEQQKIADDLREDLLRKAGLK